MLLGLGIIGITPQVGLSQPIAAPDGTGTQVTGVGNFSIGGGSLSADQHNLFHSFSQFNLSTDQTATFLANPQLRNILGRIGGDASRIDGLIRVSGGNANLFLMNPAGVIFGPGARLDVPGSFNVSTANAIQFGGGLFNATGPNSYGQLNGSPTGFAFSSSQPGGILNQGNLTVPAGQFLQLLGGSVASSGSLNGGAVTIAAVPGTSLIRLSLPGQVLSLDLPSGVAGSGVPIAALPDLLTLGVGPGDLSVRQVQAETATVSASRNLSLGQGTITTRGDQTLRAGGVVQVRDSSLLAGGSLTVQGGSIDILSLNTPTPAIQSGGALTLRSDGLISGDAQFRSGGPFSIVTTNGNPAGLVSLYDPIISVVGDVTIGPYNGASLKIEATGSITTGAITINAPDTLIPGSDPDSTLLSGTQTVILRAGLTALSNPVGSVGTPPIPATTITSGTNPANITVGGDILVTDPITNLGVPGPVILAAPGNVTVNGKIEARGFDGQAPLTIQAGQSIVITGDINTAPGSILSQPGIIFTAGQNIDIGGGISTQLNSDISSDVNLIAGQSITVQGPINTTNNGTPTSGGVFITSGENITLQSTIDTSSSAVAGNVFLTAGGDISFVNILTNGTAFNSTIQNGGNVSLVSNGVIRGVGTGTTIDTATLSRPTAGVTNRNLGGTIDIQHNGGPNNVPFIVGDASQNGTAGSITRGGTNVINPTQSFPVLPTGGDALDTPDGITITSINSAPVISPDSITLTGTPGQPNTRFQLSDLITITDADADNLLLTIDSTGLDGSLTRPDGTIVAPGDLLALTDPLIYTFDPNSPNGFTTPVNVLQVSATDTVSKSNLAQFDSGRSRFGDDDIPGPPILLNGIAPPAPPCIPIDTGVISLDQGYSKDFEDYLSGGSSGDAASQALTDICDDLGTVAGVTGIKPAIVYLSFVPAQLPLDEAFSQSRPLQEADNDILEIVVIQADRQPIIKRVPTATRAQVTGQVRALRETVMDILDPEGFKEPAQALYRDLIAPIAPALNAQSIGSLAFIVDEGLRGLPLAALHDGKQFLVEQYSLALLPSLGLSNTRYAAIGQAQLLAMGASEFPTSAGQAPLPAAAVELDVITRQLWTGRSFLNQDFTRDRLKGERKAQPFGILHLATHADFKPGKLADSYIQLWDSRLTMDRVRELGWNSPPLKLLVLSACKTAIGDRQSELGFAGLAAQTGVKSALASLWYVSDQGTLALMSEFYGQLRPAPFKAEALRQAQLAMLHNKLTIENDGIKLADGRRLQIPQGVLEPGSVDLTHPYYWSAFTLVGSPW